MRKRIALAAVVALAGCMAGGATDGAAPGGTAPDGAVLFGTHCVLCHGKDGRLGLSGARDLTLSQLTREEVAVVVAGGRGRMAGYRNSLTAAELEAVVDHVMAMRTGAPGARP
ncbi:MAG: cytochrome c [Flavobacteriales bacterium]|nr:hypothetical protein [Flavobacteriales bacterium]MCC6577480.1 cytochrome c [Flavobacteriales bacterium]NUQ14232.1 cytochrome c [Flavobacteriales bacterium]